jgi:hypothetical protein
MQYKENNILKAALSGYLTTPSTQSTTYEIYIGYVYTNSLTPDPISIPYPMYFTCYTTNEDFGYYPYTVVYNN